MYMFTATVAGVDFISIPLNASVPAGQTNTTVTVPILQDNIVENNEMFSLQLVLPVSIPGVTLAGVNTAMGTILDSTGINCMRIIIFALCINHFFLILVQVSFQQNTYSVDEGNNVSIEVVLSAFATQQYTINITSTDNTATGM